MGKTITGSSTIGVTLLVNPTTIAGTIATSGYAVYGPATKAWTLVNDGRIDSSNAVGVYLPGGGKVTNAKHDSIGGNDEAVFMVGTAALRIKREGDRDGDHRTSGERNRIAQDKATKIAFAQGSRQMAQHGRP